MSAGVLLDRTGNQSPRIMTVPSYHHTIGPQVVELAALAGLFLDPWQQLVIEHMFGRRADGSLSSSEVAVIVARQNGKGAIIEAAQLAYLFLTDEPQIVYTAHEVKTANKMFIRIKDLIDKSPKLKRRCLAPRNSNGQQAIRTRSGQILEFLARSSGSGRGFSSPRLFLDEAMFLDDRHTSALGPTLLAMNDPQVSYFSSAPRAEDLTLNALCDRGQAGTSKRLSYFEWSPEPPPPGVEIDLDDRRLWAQALPAFGYRLTEEKVQEQRGILGDAGFAREILSIREDPGAGGVITEAQWLALEDVASACGEVIAFALDVPPDRSHTVISASGVRADGKYHVEVIDDLPGTELAVERMRTLQSWRPVVNVVDPNSPAGSLIPELEAAGVPVTKTTTRDVGAATAMVLDAVKQDNLRHLADAALLAAVRGATLRDVGDGAAAWNRKNLSVDISFLVSATLALWGFVVNQDNVTDITQVVW